MRRELFVLEIASVAVDILLRLKTSPERGAFWCANETQE